MSYTVNCSILLTDLPLLERPSAARAAGFDNVEFWWPFASSTPDAAEVDAFVQAIRRAGVQLTGLNFAAGDMPGGDRGLVSWPERSEEFRSNLDAVTQIGERLGCSFFNALYGNRVEGATAEQQDTLGAENLALACAAVARIGGTVLLEPVSGAPAYPLTTAAEVIAVIDRVKSASANQNISLLADYYHLSVNGDDVDAVIASHGADFGHIQIADAPGRGEPGTGTLPLMKWIDASRDAGYSGPIGLEYKSTAEDPFAWLAAADRGAADRAGAAV